MNPVSFTFDGYTVRKIETRDVAYINKLIAQDPYHQDKMTAEFFTKLQHGEDAWALEDQKGAIVFYFKTTVTARIDIQFAPINKHEIMLGLMRGLAWLEVQLSRNGFRELFFAPDSPQLANFAKSRLGFVEAEPTLVTSLRIPQVLKIESSDVGSLPTDGLEGTGTG